ncbi:xanthine dehydrogenase accessory protein XdhC [Ciceribacter sp. L1K23]|uniref:xanthine dehydrogenase accessory protein XdhC n=1 Tax=Ciceribacter sp. L1K23 TaxID=2820276 RepID=UPI001B81EC0F|nr:xanthine dehydrogenase accessory protein XdhC [Ciceribacter sp. L1K23]MBR0554688.1 xanthine dehydrogenase accessory protein XdhC [Ciceribacter sp. L1K23]
MPFSDYSEFLAAHPRLILVEVLEAKGSTPREAGAFMLVATEGTSGTIGGGYLEFMTIDHARRLLAGDNVDAELDVPLGPEIGQCCGGRTRIGFIVVDEAVRENLLRREDERRAADPDVMIFGAGHVGLALASALSSLPFNVSVIETRSIDETALPRNIIAKRVAMPEAEIAAIRPGGAVLILTHDHALDFLIARQALARRDLAYVGMIGSATKRATFRHWLEREGGETNDFARLTLPIGGDTVRDKRPPVIAAMVAAELCRVLLDGRT